MARPHEATLRVEGYRELLRALKNADKESLKAVRAILRRTGEAVQSASRTRVAVLKDHDAKTAAGYKIRVRQRGLAVEQALRKTSGLHPEWGAWQMRHALVPSLNENREITNQLMEQAFDEIAAKFNHSNNNP